jgi:nitrogen regulatory protein P-II 2
VGFKPAAYSDYRIMPARYRRYETDHNLRLEFIMKLIIAYIQPHRLEEVKRSLAEANVGKMSVTNSLGCGAQKGYHESYRGVEFDVNLLKKVRIEIAVTDDFLDKTTDAIIAGARTGEIGDGKIFILELVNFIRVRTGETGKDAVG